MPCGWRSRLKSARSATFVHGAHSIWHPDRVPIAFRALRRSDFPRLSRWLAAPHVAMWWRHPHDDADLEAEFGPVVDGRDPTEIFIVEEDGLDVGLIQRYRLDDDPQWEQAVAVGSSPRPAVGIDYLIGEESRIGHGLGPRIIACFIDVTWERSSRRGCRRRRRATGQPAVVPGTGEGGVRTGVVRHAPERRPERRRAQSCLRPVAPDHLKRRWTATNVDVSASRQSERRQFGRWPVERGAIRWWPDRRAARI